MNILVLCTGNSARSILLECLLAKLGDGRITSFSAGSQPSGAVHQQSLRLLRAKGYDVANLSSKSWDVFAESDAPQMDVAITVCGSAANETCPMWPGVPLRSHWGVDDPAAALPEDAQTAFEQTYQILQRRALAFLSAKIETMDTPTLQRHLDQAGATL